MPVRAVLFDLGNTLVAYYDGAEFPQVLRECLQQCAAVLGWPEDAARDDALFARAMALNAESPDCAVRPLDRRLSELFGLDGSVDASTLPRLCDAFLKPIFQRARLDPEAIPVLQSLRERDIKVGIVSNSPWGSSASLWRQELTRHGLLERVDAAVFCGDVGWRKPNPAPFNRALELLQVAPQDALFVGDDVRWDLVGAQNAGLRPVLLRSTVHRLSDVLDLVDSPRESDAAARPFYGEYAWAYDLLIDRPVSKECSTIVAWLVERGVLPGAAVLDVGCGTGRYASELCRRGYLVTGIDRSPELISQAKQAAAVLHRSVRFAIGDLVSLPADECDAILCRGVLNDLVDENIRESAFSAFGRALRPKGVVILDVREWNATAQRKAREPLFRKTVATDRGTLSFTSHTELDPTNRRLVIAERHTLTRDGHERSSDCRFVMQCWTRDELASYLRRSGFGAIAYFGAYDATIQAGEADRLVVVAQRDA
jgi:putative hydrolase of the HAD superfamily